MAVRVGPSSFEGGMEERRISGGCRLLGLRVERDETDRMGKKTDAPPCFLPIFHIDIPLYKLQTDASGRGGTLLTVSCLALNAVQVC